MWLLLKTRLSTRRWVDDNNAVSLGAGWHLIRGGVTAVRVENVSNEAGGNR